MKPKIVLIVGNGFSRGFVKHLNLNEEVATSQLIPPPEWVTYMPFDNDPQVALWAEGKPLWSPDLFPLLWQDWLKKPAEKSPKEYLKGLYEQYALEEREFLLSSKIRGKISFCPRSHRAYQLRAYLFNLFREYERILDKNGSTQGIGGWEWVIVLHILIRYYEITIVSFNYDCIIEKIISYPLEEFKVYQPILDFWYSKESLAMSRRVKLLKPHGSMSHRSGTQFNLGSNKWLSEEIDLEYKHNIFVGYVPTFPIREYPTIPDLVPPGHAGDHLFNPQFDFVSTISKEIANCDGLILCGLSASEPDKSEVEGYLQALRKNIPVIHVGLKNGEVDDEMNDAGILLRRYGLYQEFCNIENHEKGICSIPNRLNALFGRNDGIGRILNIFSSDEWKEV